MLELFFQFRQFITEYFGRLFAWFDTQKTGTVPTESKSVYVRLQIKNENRKPKYETKLLSR